MYICIIFIKSEQTFEITRFRAENSNTYIKSKGPHVRVSVL